MRLLLVEDNEDLGDAVAVRFRRLGHAVEWLCDGERAAAMLARERFDLIILDLMLSGLDGTALLAERRGAGDHTPVLVLTARARIDDRVDVLDLGADDYLVKPFDFRELEARVRVLLRRGGGHAESRQRHGELVFDAAARRVYHGDQPLELPNREFRLLEIFLARHGRVLSKQALADHLFGLDLDTPAPNAIEVYVARLRRRLAGTGVRIRTLRGQGYIAESTPPGEGP